MELKERQVLTLFPTCLFAGKVSDLSLCDRVETALRAMKLAAAGAADETFFMTRDDIHTLPQMKELSDLVLAETNQILDFYRVKRQSHYITNMWGNITNPNHRQAMHIHPNCLLSGIIYVTAPPDCGPTQFSDPRPGARMLEPAVTQLTEHNNGTFMVAPDKGVMVVWPSFLPHAVERGQNRTHADRIIVAFNVMIRGVIDTATARLELK